LKQLIHAESFILTENNQPAVAATKRRGQLLQASLKNYTK